jgi:hypothetical protein
MTTNTPNLSLVLYDDSTDLTATFLMWRLQISGPAVTSNFQLVDAWAGKYGLPTAPASGLINVLGIGNGGTGFSNKPLFDTGLPAYINGTTGVAGVATVSARRDHEHALPSGTGLDANTTNHGLLITAVAPAAGLINVLGIGNGETIWSNKPLFDTTNPAKIGTAAPGSQLIGARRDHVHDIDNASSTGIGAVELAIASEVDASVDTARAITPDALAGSNFGERCVQISLNGGLAALTTGDLAKLVIPSAMTGMNLVEVGANVGLNGVTGSSSSGIVAFTIKKGAVGTTGSTSMLSVNLTVDAGEYDSSTAATGAVINSDGTQTVGGGDVVYVGTTGAGTGVIYSNISLVFRQP